VAKKHIGIRFSVIAPAFVVGLAVVAAAAALRLTKNPDYWLSAGALLVAVLLPTLAHLRRDPSASKRSRGP